MPLHRLACLAALALFSTQVGAQESNWRSFASVTPIFEGDADLDRGGEFSVQGVLLRIGTATAFEGGHTFGVTLNYDYYDYSFSNPVSFGGVAPWDKTMRYGVSAPLTFALNDGWRLGITPSVDWFRENGADTGESLVYGAGVFAIRDFGGGNRLGFGVSAVAHIEDTKVFPVLLVDWNLGDRWRLINPLPAGPSGPAGLELDYRFDNDWTLGIGGAYRVSRYRLSQSGPVPDGVGEVTGVPIFLRATRNLGDSLTLNLYVGALAQGRLRVEDRNGNLLREDDFGLAPLFALTLLGRF
jgi:hypothetical protein